MANADIVRSFVGALQRKDAETAGGFLTDDAVKHVPGRNRFSGAKEGRDAVVRFIEEFPVSDIEPHDILENQDHVVVLVRRKIAGADAPAAVVYHVEDGKISSIWIHEQDQYAVDEALA